MFLSFLCIAACSVTAEYDINQNQVSFLFDLLSVVPFFVSVFNSGSNLDFLRAFKLARIGKMARHNNSLRLVGITLKGYLYYHI